MKMLSLTILILFSFYSHSLFGQLTNGTNDSIAGCNSYSEFSDTTFIPWYGNENFLDSFLNVSFPQRDSLINASSNISSSNRLNVIYNSGSEDVIFRVPVKIYIHRNDDGGFRSISINEAKNQIQRMNNNFSRNFSGIEFYLFCEPEFVDITSLNIGVTDNEFDFMKNLSQYRDDRVFNIHFVWSANNEWAGRATFPWDFPNFFTVVSTHNPAGIEFRIGQLNRLLVHEMGHCLGLLHTFESPDPNTNYNGDASRCWQEPVSRTITQEGPPWCWTRLNRLNNKKCEINGDYLCETEGQPNRNNVNNGNRIANAVFRGTAPDVEFVTCDGQSLTSDVYNVTWNNTEVTNYMSYIATINANGVLAPVPCRTTFVVDQIAAMHFYLRACFGYGGSFPGIGEYDGELFGGVPYYNRDIINVYGTSFAGDDDEIYSPRTINLGVGGDYLVEDQTEILFSAVEDVNLYANTEILRGSEVLITTSTINDCSLTYSFSPGISHGKVSEEDRISLMRSIFDNSQKTKSTKDEFTKDGEITLQIFPNPASNLVTISLKSPFDIDNLYFEIFDYQGNLELSKTIYVGGQRMNFDLALQNLKPGSYIYKAYTKQKIISIDKLIII